MYKNINIKNKFNTKKINIITNMLKFGKQSPLKREWINSLRVQVSLFVFMFQR